MQYAENHRALQAHAIVEVRSLPADDQFLVSLYIYCRPCTCQVATALSICYSASTFRQLDIHVRVDYRLPTCCSMATSRIDGIVSLINYVKAEESNTFDTCETYHTSKLRSVDRQWSSRLPTIMMKKPRSQRLLLETYLPMSSNPTARKIHAPLSLYLAKRLLHPTDEHAPLPSFQAWDTAKGDSAL